MSISFNGYDEKLLTFKASGSIADGATVKISANETVSACSADDVFCGVCLGVKNGLACVKLSGYHKLTYSGNTAPSLGYTNFAADGSGKVKVPTSGGKSLLVVDVDTTSKTVGVIL